MGLPPKNKRYCIPIDERAQKALRAEQQPAPPNSFNLDLVIRETS